MNRPPPEQFTDEPSVEGVRPSAYQVPTDHDEADGTLAWNSTGILVVQVNAADTTGLGWSYTAPAAAADVVTNLLTPVIEGHSALDVPHANEAMHRTVRNAGRPGLVAHAISAVDIALWDLKARLLNLPLATLLGRCRHHVPVYGSGGFTTYDDNQQHQQLHHWVDEQGIQRVKIKIGESWGTEQARDLHRVERARTTVGDADLYVDANGAYTTKAAVRIGHDLDHLGVPWFEEPVSSDDLNGLRTVRAALSCDIAAGEYGTTLPYFATLAPAVDCLQADVTRCGGITVWLRAAALAEATGLQISGHCAPHAHAHAAAAVPNLRHLEWFHDHVRVENTLFHGTLDPTGGTITPAPDRPGHGLELRAAPAEPFRVATSPRPSGIGRHP